VEVQIDHPRIEVEVCRTGQVREVATIAERRPQIFQERLSVLTHTFGFPVSHVAEGRRIVEEHLQDLDDVANGR